MRCLLVVRGGLKVRAAKVAGSYIRASADVRGSTNDGVLQSRWSTEDCDLSAHGAPTKTLTDGCVHMKRAPSSAAHKGAFELNLNVLGRPSKFRLTQLRKRPERCPDGELKSGRGSGEKYASLPRKGDSVTVQTSGATSLLSAWASPAQSMTCAIATVSARVIRLTRGT